MTSGEQDLRLSDIAVKPAFRTIDGVSIRLTSSDRLRTLRREDSADEYAAGGGAWRKRIRCSFIVEHGI